MNLLWVAAATTAWILWRQKQSVATPTWQSWIVTLGVTPLESKIDFCSAVAVLGDPKTTKVETFFPAWAATQKTAILVDADVQLCKLPVQGSLKVYAVDPNKVEALLKTGVFVLYKRGAP